MKPFDIMRAYGIRAQKKLGQNFLVDNNICEKIAHGVPISSSDTVLEIGAGFGMLTSALAHTAGRVIAVERDPKLCDVLQREIVPLYSHVEVIHNSILEVDPRVYAEKAPLVVMGNLPYYLTSKILFYMVEYRAHIRAAVITIQKEVADRILAVPGGKDYGRLTVMLRLYAETERLFDIKPQSFSPTPEVSSTVLKLTFHAHPLPDLNEALFAEVVRAMFQERRKTVLNSLQLIRSREVTKSIARDILEQVGIDHMQRPEKLMIKDFIALTQKIQNCALKVSEGT